MEKINIGELSINFERDNEEFTVLDQINLKVQEGKFICFLGPSGCGKTTLLNVIAGFITPTKGLVEVNGLQVKTAGPDRGYVFQEYALFPWMSIYKNIEFGLLNKKDMTKAERNEIVNKSLKMVGLGEFSNSYPHMLSGGMKQRAAIARALAPDPDILLMDEPFAALDAQTRRQMQIELIKIWEQTGKTVVFVTHSIEEAIILADEIVILSPRPGRLHSVQKLNAPRLRDMSNPDIIALKEYLYNTISSFNDQAAIS